MQVDGKRVNATVVLQEVQFSLLEPKHVKQS